MGAKDLAKRHTPGPWECDTGGQPVIINGPDGRIVAVVFDNRCPLNGADPAYQYGEETAASNARLISLVPEMYGMLGRIMGVADTAASLLHKSCPEEAELFRRDSKAIRELINKIEEV